MLVQQDTSVAPIPNTQAYLNTLGFGTTTFIGGSVFILGGPARNQFTPTAFTALQFVGGNFIVQEQDTAGPWIAGINGLNSLLQVWPFAQR
jgi:hypothetical protein